IPRAPPARAARACARVVGVGAGPAADARAGRGSPRRADARMTVRRARAALPLADATALERAARRTVAVRGALGVLLVALVGAALLAAPRAAADRHRGSGPVGGTVVVLDLSSSTGQSRGAIHDALAGVIRAAGGADGVGLVVFSNVAEEALPTGTPALELAAF